MTASPKNQNKKANQSGSDNIFENYSPAPLPKAKMERVSFTMNEEQKNLIWQTTLKLGNISKKPANNSTGLRFILDTFGADHPPEISTLSEDVKELLSEDQIQEIEKRISKRKEFFELYSRPGSTGEKMKAVTFSITPENLDMLNMVSLILSVVSKKTVNNSESLRFVLATFGDEYGKLIET